MIGFVTGSQRRICQYLVYSNSVKKKKSPTLNVYWNMWNKLSSWKKKLCRHDLPWRLSKINCLELFLCTTGPKFESNTFKFQQPPKKATY